MDIINGYSIIVAKDEKTAKIISDAVGFEFKDLKAKTNELVRKVKPNVPLIGENDIPLRDEIELEKQLNY